MNKKLTLYLDEEVIHQAKAYASKQNQSLSKLVEQYFYFLTTQSSEKKDLISMELQELIGIVKIPDELDIKKDYRDYRAKKSLND